MKYSNSKTSHTAQFTFNRNNIYTSTIANAAVKNHKNSRNKHSKLELLQKLAV